jgi:hypothetical protein
VLSIIYEIGRNSPGEQFVRCSNIRIALDKTGLQTAENLAKMPKCKD